MVNFLSPTGVSKLVQTLTLLRCHYEILFILYTWISWWGWEVIQVPSYTTPWIKPYDTYHTILVSWYPPPTFPGQPGGAVYMDVVMTDSHSSLDIRTYVTLLRSSRYCNHRTLGISSWFCSPVITLYCDSLPLPSEPTSEVWLSRTSNL